MAIRFFGRGPEGELQPEQQSPEERLSVLNKDIANLEMWMGQQDAKHPADPALLEKKRFEREAIYQENPNLRQEGDALEEEQQPQE